MPPKICRHAFQKDLLSYPFSLPFSSVGQGDWALGVADRLQQSGVLRHAWFIYDLCTAAHILNRMSWLIFYFFIYLCLFPLGLK